MNFISQFSVAINSFDLNYKFVYVCTCSVRQHD